MRRLAYLFLAMTLAAPLAHAQDEDAMVERLDRLERDLNFVQKQVYRSGGSTGESGVPINNGQAIARMAQIDEEIRQIRGLIEQSQFQNKQTAAELKKLSDDVDYRLRALEQKQTAAATPVAPTPAAEPAATAATPPETMDAVKPAPAGAEPKTAAYQPEGTDGKTALTGKDFPNSNAHYSYAFKLLNEKKYAESAQSFDAFVKKYPTDPLTSNAFYWLGESQYSRGDFTRSAESFRKGFESAPDGQKAPDNLYKLAMSLSQIKRKSEACIVLQQVAAKYAESSARTAAKAVEARTTLQCK